ncbi:MULTISPECIES: AtuA-related protein [Solibacillus]|uniref:AtuA-like ferredoxin-fold domain-containing protein n=1 Tax=Solibacillus merdavium TaxID=2762218 RepID=A0ABR8XQW1_9BACL|nr:hypothetical protein [Solibacillus merdavium]MBD8034334.1 hypothetical protein [Solibacillus merdavium]
MKLYEVAHCRTGDKGNTLTMSIIAFKKENYPLLLEQVTVDKVKDHLQGIVLGDVERYELPSLGALQFVCHEALDTGVTTSLAMDTHGKTLSYSILELELS